LGYRLLVGDGNSGEREEAGITQQTGVGTYGFEAGRTPGLSNYRVNVSGGLALLDKGVYFTRRITDSFAVAQVQGFPNIGIYTNSQLVARTNSEGYAVIPTLGSYQNNQVSIDAGELPMDAQIETTQITAVPYYRSGLALRFSVKLSHGALLNLTLDDGEPAPIGTEVRVAGQENEFPVGMRGEVYVTGLEETNQLQAIWNKQTCSFSVDVPPDSGPTPRFGPIRCSGVKR
jgi:outer membrane usher protein